MESFLKNRPVHVTPETGASSVPPAVSPVGTDSPFAPIHQSGAKSATGPAPASPSAVRSEPAVVEIDAGCSSDGASVRAIMERGRITKLIVTCSCGKVTEVACQY